MRRQFLTRGLVSMRGVASLAVAVALVLSCPGLVKAASLVPNYDFETNAVDPAWPDFWFHGSPTAYVLDDDSDGTGTRSAAVLGSTDWRSQGFAVTQGEELTWSVDYKVLSGTTGSVRADLRFFDFADAVGSTFGQFRGEDVHPIDDLSLVADDTWRTLGPYVFNAPVSGQVTMFGDIRLSAGLFGEAMTGTVQFDKVVVTRVREPASIGVLATCCLACGWLVRRSPRRR